jgi:hypothetical protein
MGDPVPQQEKMLHSVSFDIVPSDQVIDPERFSEFVRVLKESNFLRRITQHTGLEWQDGTLRVEYSKKADYTEPNTIFVDYNRGDRAVSSAVHESVHLMLRQDKWTENPAVADMLKKHHELTTSSSKGPAYKVEQIFAYLLQNEIFKEIAKAMSFDASKHYWSIDYIKENFVHREFKTEFLKSLALAVIEVWEEPNRENDIYKLIKRVDDKLSQK